LSNIIPILPDAFCYLGSYTVKNTLRVDIKILTTAVLKLGTSHIIAVQLVDAYVCLSAVRTASGELWFIIIG